MEHYFHIPIALMASKATLFSAMIAFLMLIIFPHNAVVMGLGELAAFFGTKKVTAYPNPNSQPC